MQEVFCTFYDIESTIDLQPCGKEIKANYAFEKSFFVKKPGYYNFGDSVYLVDKEGLYRFKNDEGILRQFYYFKNDIKTLMKALFYCLDYQGKVDAVPIFFDSINTKLSFTVEKYLQPSTLLNNTLPIIGVPVRQISLYSKKLQNGFLEFLEVWDDLQKSWALFSIDKTSFLGYTNKDLPSWLLLERFIQGEVKEQALADGLVKNSVLFSDDIREKINLALKDSSLLKDLAKELEAVFVYRLDGVLVMKVCALEQDREFLPNSDINLHENMDINYKVNFYTEKDFLSKNYGEKIYVSPGYAIKTV